MIASSAMNESVIAECSFNSKSKWFRSCTLLSPQGHIGESVLPILCNYGKKRSWLNFSLVAMGGNYLHLRSL